MIRFKTIIVIIITIIVVVIIIPCCILRLNPAYIACHNAWIPLDASKQPHLLQAKPKMKTFTETKLNKKQSTWKPCENNEEHKNGLAHSASALCHIPLSVDLLFPF